MSDVVVEDFPIPFPQKPLEAKQPVTSEIVIGSQNVQQRGLAEPVREVFDEIKEAVGNSPAILVVQENADGDQIHTLSTEGSVSQHFKDPKLGEHRTLSTIYTQERGLTLVGEKRVLLPEPPRHIHTRAIDKIVDFLQKEKISGLRRGVHVSVFEYAEPQTGEKVSIRISNGHLSLQSHGGQEQKMIEARAWADELQKMDDEMGEPKVDIIMGDLNTSGNPDSELYKSQLDELRRTFGVDYQDVTSDIPWTLNVLQSGKGILEKVKSKFLKKTKGFDVGIVREEPKAASDSSRRKIYHRKTDHAFVRSKDWEITGIQTINNRTRVLDHKGIVLTLGKKSDQTDLPLAA